MMGGIFFGTIDPAVALMIASAVIATVAFAIFGGILIFGEQRHTSKRLTRVVQRWQPGTAVADGSPSLRISQKDSSLPSIDRILKRILPRREMLRRRLRRTGMSISVGQYVSGCVATGLVSGLVQVGLFDVALPVAILGATAAGLALPHMFVGHLGRKRQKKL